MTANIRCKRPNVGIEEHSLTSKGGNCPLSQSEWIWAGLWGGEVEDQTSVTTSLQQHSQYGNITIAASGAVGGPDTTPFNTSTPFDSTTSSTTTTSSLGAPTGVSGGASSSSSSTSRSDGLDGSSAELSAGAIAGVVVGVVGILLIMVGLYVWQRKRSAKSKSTEPRQGTQDPNNMNGKIQSTTHVEGKEKFIRTPLENPTPAEGFAYGVEHVPRPDEEQIEPAATRPHTPERPF
jgi:hypothetical protein